VIDSEGNGVALPMPPPIDAVAQDAEAAAFMLKSYDPDLWHRIQFDRGLDREAILAEALMRRRWPNGPRPKPWPRDL
jgi:hypothetical protein